MTVRGAVLRGDAVLPDTVLRDAVVALVALGAAGEDEDVTGRGAVLRGDAVLPDAVLRDAAVVLVADRIAWVGPAEQVPEPWRAPPPTGLLLLPGLVDVHNHGGGGVSFPDAETRSEVRTACDEHLRHGTTSLVASLVTAPSAVLLERVVLLAGAEEVAGIHVEGPFLSGARAGAQNPDHMGGGDVPLVDALVAAARGRLVSMTVAPEVPGVADGRPRQPDVLSALVESGVLVSFGHTDASYEQVVAAVGRVRALTAGSRRATATHLFNGMPPWHHRDPGAAAACLDAAARGDLVVELVADGAHLAAGTVRTVAHLVGPGGWMLVSDATAATGQGDGTYRLGPVDVVVADGVAHLAGFPGTLAGSTSHLLDQVRRVVAAGIALVDAVRAAATTPATVAGLTDVGALRPGLRADVLATGTDLVPRQVWRSGQRVI